MVSEIKMIKTESEVVKPLVNINNEVLQWVFKVTGTDEDTGVSEAIECIHDVSDQPLERYMFWTKEGVDVEKFKCIQENDMIEKARKRVEARINKVVEASEFDYNNLPSN